METESEYSVQMYWEVLCKLCLVQLQRAARIECWFLSAYTQLNKHRHKCFISDVREAGKCWPNRLSLERLLSTKSYNNFICLNIQHVLNKKLSCIKKGNRVITIADICRHSVQYNVEKLSNLWTHKNITEYKLFTNMITNNICIQYSAFNSSDPSWLLIFLFTHFLLHILAGVQRGAREGEGVGEY